RPARAPGRVPVRGRRGGRAAPRGQGGRGRADPGGRVRGGAGAGVPGVRGARARGGARRVFEPRGLAAPPGRSLRLPRGRSSARALAGGRAFFPPGRRLCGARAGVGRLPHRRGGRVLQPDLHDLRARSRRAHGPLLGPRVCPEQGRRPARKLHGRGLRRRGRPRRPAGRPP
ncbi:hypothetical protein H632_c5269p0, partial [Helicosporidium sp. ATCC 50920]